MEIEKENVSVKLISDDVGGPTLMNGSMSSNGTHYILEGSSKEGNCICCIHGIGGFNFVFENLSRELIQAGFCVLRYDLIGRGFSNSSSNDRYGAEEHIQQLFQLLEEVFPSSKVTLIGHSMGGALASLFAQTYPNKVNSLILLCPAGLMNSGALPMLRSCSCLHGSIRSSLSKPAAQEKAWRSDFFNKDAKTQSIQNEMVSRLKEMDRLNPGGFHAFWMSALQFPLYGLQKEIGLLSKENIVVMLIWGDKDTVVPMEPSLGRYRELLEEKKLLGGGETKLHVQIIKNAGHGLLFEKSTETNNAILEFLHRDKR
jgi:pimeloyl-ACP methyl ester carboxylesterase